MNYWVIIIATIVIIILIIFLGLIFIISSGGGTNTIGMSIKDIPIYCISCKDDDERRQLTKYRFDEKGIKFDFFDAVDGREISRDIFRDEHKVKFGGESDVGARGCALSHKKLWDLQVENKIPYLYITEDDVVFHDDYNSLVEKFKIPLDAGIFFVGHCGHIDDYIKNDEILEIFPMCLHAYILRLDAAQFLIDNFDCDNPIDIYISELYKKNKNKLKWKVYGIYNGKSISDKSEGCDGCKFRGLVYQDRDMKRAIHRHMNGK